MAEVRTATVERVRTPVSAELAAELPVMVLIVVVLPPFAMAGESSYLTVLRRGGCS
jgi:hypothetical protein